jgi:hypothetical protein
VRPWVFWTGAGATAVSGALIGVFAVQKHNAVNDFHRDIAAAAPSVVGSTLVADQQRAQSAAHHVNIMIGVTAGLAATTAILAYFTDWHSARDAALLDSFYSVNR